MRDTKQVTSVNYFSFPTPPQKHSIVQQKNRLVYNYMDHPFQTFSPNQFQIVCPYTSLLTLYADFWSENFAIWVKSDWLTAYTIIKGQEKWIHYM